MTSDAIAELEFVLKFSTELGVALGKGRRVRLHPTRAGVEICSLYPSHADALAAATRIRDLPGDVESHCSRSPLNPARRGARQAAGTHIFGRQHH
jgi:hypothetical protein